MLAVLLSVRCWAVVSCVLAPVVLAADDWPRFRGPNGTAAASAPGLPTEWTADDYAWETLLPGVGHSSPVVGDGRLFVTTGSEDGASRQLICLNPDNGKIVWTRKLSLTRDKLHAKNSHASGSPALTDESVVVTFADDDRYLVSAYGLDGAPLWSRDLGPFESQHGHGSSPIVWQDLVIVPNDQDGPSTLVALDLRSGDVVWTAQRASGNTAYGTPFILEADGKAPQLIASSQAMGITSLDPATGTLNWKSGPLPQRTVGSPAYAGGLVFQTCGQAGRGVLMIGVDPFAASDDKRIVFTEDKLLPYVPTPVACNDRLYLLIDLGGVVVCLDTKTLRPAWDQPERIGGNYSASPVCVNGLLYFVSEEGEVVVARTSPDFEVVGRSSLGDNSHATPAVADGKMFFRTFHKVVCLAAKENAN